MLCWKLVTYSYTPVGSETTVNVTSPFPITFSIFQLFINLALDEEGAVAGGFLIVSWAIHAVDLLVYKVLTRE
ncbi:hypothetical protein ACET3Z_006284 [Daucus carota]